MGQSCSKNTGDDDIEQLKKLNEPIEAERKRKAEAEKEAARERERNMKVEVVLKERGAGTQRDRIIALLAVHDPDKLQHIDEIMEKLPHLRRQEGYIKDFMLKRDVEKEPVNKYVAIEAMLKKKFPNDRERVASELEKFKKVKAGEENSFFDDIFGVQAAGVKQEVTKSLGELENVASVDVSASLELASRPRRRIKRQLPSGEVHSETDEDDIECTCDDELKDRIFAMLIKYDPERLASIKECREFPDSESGAELLFNLIDQHGEEPPSKRVAITNCLQDLLGEHDPLRLRSLSTLVAAAMSRKDGMQIVRKLLRSYGVVKEPEYSDFIVATSSASASSQSSSSSSSEPAAATSAASGISPSSSSSSSSSTTATTLSVPPRHMRSVPFVSPYQTQVDGGVRKEFKPLPENKQQSANLISNYEAANRMLDQVPQRSPPSSSSAASACAAAGDENEQESGEENESRKKLLADASPDSKALIQSLLDDNDNNNVADDASGNDNKQIELGEIKVSTQYEDEDDDDDDDDDHDEKPVVAVVEEEKGDLGDEDDFLSALSAKNNNNNNNNAQKEEEKEKEKEVARKLAQLEGDDDDEEDAFLAGLAKKEGGAESEQQEQSKPQPVIVSKPNVFSPQQESMSNRKHVILPDISPQAPALAN